MSFLLNIGEYIGELHFFFLHSIGSKASKPRGRWGIFDFFCKSWFTFVFFIKRKKLAELKLSRLLLLLQMEHDQQVPASSGTSFYDGLCTLKL